MIAEFLISVVLPLHWLQHRNQCFFPQPMCTQNIISVSYNLKNSPSGPLGIKVCLSLYIAHSIIRRGNLVSCLQTTPRVIRAQLTKLRNGVRVGIPFKLSAKCWLVHKNHQSHPGMWFATKNGVMCSCDKKALIRYYFQSLRWQCILSMWYSPMEEVRFHIQFCY